MYNNIFDIKSSINNGGSLFDNQTIMPMIPKNVSVPHVEIEDEKGSLRVYDIFSTLNKSRIIIVDGEVNDMMASVIIAQLLYLDKADKQNNFKTPIQMYINSPGGSVTAGNAIFDTMMHVKCPIITIGLGMCASMGAFLLSAGRAKKKDMNAEPYMRSGAFALPSTEIMIHQPLGGFQGQATDFKIHADRIIKMKEELVGKIAYFAVKDRDLTKEQIEEKVKQIKADCERDHFLTAEEAKAYGLIDDVIYSESHRQVVDEMKELGLM